MKKKILDVAAQLIEQYGLRKFTIDEIAEKLKISKKTIYQYYSSKNEIIREYFEAAVESDKINMMEALNQNQDFCQKIHSIVYSNHCYRLSVSLLYETKQFFPEEWIKIEELKVFKLNTVRNLLEQGIADGIIRTDIHIGVFTKMLEEISDMFVDYDFLLENKLRASEAMDKVLNIIFTGILNKKDEYEGF
jgi:AcrR family transcriptional regulator